MTDQTTRRRITRKEWVWCAYPGHFIGSSECLMHLHTRVGDFRISTVGDYRPRGRDGERPTSPTPIGAGPDALFETYVFAVTGSGLHGEGEVTDYAEVDGERYAAAEDAEAGHMRYCEKYAKMGAQR